MPKCFASYWRYKIRHYRESDATTHTKASASAAFKLKQYGVAMNIINAKNSVDETIISNSRGCKKLNAQRRVHHRNQLKERINKILIRNPIDLTFYNSIVLSGDDVVNEPEPNVPPDPDFFMAPDQDDQPDLVADEVIEYRPPEPSAALVAARQAVRVAGDAATDAQKNMQSLLEKIFALNQMVLLCNVSAHQLRLSADTPLTVTDEQHRHTQHLLQTLRDTSRMLSAISLVQDEVEQHNRAQIQQELMVHYRAQLEIANLIDLATQAQMALSNLPQTQIPLSDQSQQQQQLQPAIDELSNQLCFAQAQLNTTHSALIQQITLRQDAIHRLNSPTAPQAGPSREQGTPSPPVIRFQRPRRDSSDDEGDDGTGAAGIASIVTTESLDPENKHLIFHSTPVPISAALSEARSQHEGLDLSATTELTPEQKNRTSLENLHLLQRTHAVSAAVIHQASHMTKLIEQQEGITPPQFTHLASLMEELKGLPSFVRPVNVTALGATPEEREGYEQCVTELEAQLQALIRSCKSEKFALTSVTHSSASVNQDMSTHRVMLLTAVNAAQQKLELALMVVRLHALQQKSAV